MTIDKIRLNIVQGTTCFAEHDKNSVSCQRKNCKQWINNSKDLNCVLIAAKRGPKTLQEIGNIMGTTRIRVCQAEKHLIQKIQNILNVEN